MIQSDQLTNETARWLAAAMLTLADTIKKQQGDMQNTYQQCEGFYNQMFGSSDRTYLKP